MEPQDGTPLQFSCLENPVDGGAWCAAVHGVARSWTRLSDFTFTFHFHALEKEMATHSSVLAWRIPGMGEPGELPFMGSHRVGHDWRDLAAAAARFFSLKGFWSHLVHSLIFQRRKLRPIRSDDLLKPHSYLLSSYGTKVWVFHCQNFDSCRTAAKWKPWLLDKREMGFPTHPISWLCSFPQRLCSKFLL